MVVPYLSVRVISQGLWWSDGVATLLPEPGGPSVTLDQLPMRASRNSDLRVPTSWPSSLACGPGDNLLACGGCG